MDVGRENGIGPGRAEELPEKWYKQEKHILFSTSDNRLC